MKKDEFTESQISVSSDQSLFDNNIHDPNEGKQRYVFLMSDYVNALYEVVKKNVCPYTKYGNVEMAVFSFIENLVHKCESILMDYWEYFSLGDIKELSSKIKDVGFNKHKEKINNRLKRIYGSTHESVEK